MRLTEEMIHSRLGNLRELQNSQAPSLKLYKQLRGRRLFQGAAYKLHRKVLGHAGKGFSVMQPTLSSLCSKSVTPVHPLIHCAGLPRSRFFGLFSVTCAE